MNPVAPKSNSGWKIHSPCRGSCGDSNHPFDAGLEEFASPRTNFGICADQIGFTREHAARGAFEMELVEQVFDGGNIGGLGGR